MNSVYLTGFMGTGKSSVGRSLARRLRRPFVDLDREIELAARSSVSAVFSLRGEAAFRRLERAALARAAKRPGAVVALGGGALIDSRSRALVARTGVLVRLSCSRRELLRRLRTKRASRPLLSGGPLPARIAVLMRARKAAGAAADLTVSTTGRSAAQAAAVVARRLG